MIKIGDRVETPKGPGIVLFIGNDNTATIFLDSAASSDLPDVPDSDIHKFNIDKVKFYCAGSISRWYNE